MLQDFVLGEHLLLVGNQGVGKNKLVDRFLQLLNRPREYIQLHRYEFFFKKNSLNFLLFLFQGYNRSIIDQSTDSN